MSREIVDLDRSIRMAAIMSLDARESGERQNARGERWWGVGARRTLHQPYPRALCILPSFAGIKKPKWWPVEHLRSHGYIGDWEQSLNGPRNLMEKKASNA